MAIAQFLAFEAFFDMQASVDAPKFWLAIPFAMVAGFMTNCSVDWWLVRSGIKERM